MDTIESLKLKTDVPVIVANQGGFITYINSSFTDILGWKEEDVMGKPLVMILPDSFKDSHNLSFSRFQQTEVASVLNHPLELMTISKEGNEIITEHYITAEKISGEWFFAAVLRPLE